MKYFVKVMSLTFVLLLCFICLISEVTAEESGAINIEHAFINNYYPVVGEKIYVKVYTNDIFDIPVNETGENFSYQWYRNDVNSNNGGMPLAGAEEKYYIPLSEDAGSYLYCKVTGNGKYTGEIITGPTCSAVEKTAEIGGAYIVENGNSIPKLGKEIIGCLFRYGSVAFDDYLYPAETPVDTAIYGNEVAEYQWYRTKEENNTGGTPIVGANSYKYTPTQEDYGFHLYFTASGKGGYFGSVTSNVTSYPISIVDGGGGSGDGYFPLSLSIEGAAVNHAVLTTDKHSRVKCQWYRNDLAENSGGTPIPGATFYKYIVTSEDVGKYLYVEMKKTEGGITTSVVSPVTDKVINSSAELLNVTIENSDKSNPKRHIKLTSESSMPKNATATVQWYRNDIMSNSGGEPISGASYSSYTPTLHDVGKYLYCVYTPVYPFVGEPVYSESTSAVENTATVFFDSNGADSGLGCEDIEIGGTIENIDTFVLEREGYEFNGWGTAPDKKVSDFDKNTIVKHDITLYALWNKTLCSPEPSSDVSPSPGKAVTLRYTDNGDLVTENFASNREIEVLLEQNENFSSLYIASYDKNGILKDCKYLNECKSDCSLLYTAGDDSYTLKVFLWEDMKPLLDCIVLSKSE